MQSITEEKSENKSTDDIYDNIIKNIKLKDITNANIALTLIKNQCLDNISIFEPYLLKLKSFLSIGYLPSLS